MKTAAILVALGCSSFGADFAQARLGRSMAEEFSGSIAIKSVNDPALGWNPFAYVSVGGARAVPMLVDTGSSTVAFCPDVELGDSTPVSPSMYGCDSYGDGTMWVGQYYQSSAVFGSDNKTIENPNVKDNFHFAHVSEQNADLCNPNVKGILGVDMGRIKVFTTPQTLPKCDHSNMTLPAQFRQDMLVAEDDYTMGFLDMTYTNQGNPQMCFGSACNRIVKSKNHLGTLQLTNYTDTWYTFAPNTMTFRLTGLQNQSACGDVCSYSIPYGQYLKENPIHAANTILPLLDSGTDQVFVPSQWMQSLLEQFGLGKKTALFEDLWPVLIRDFLIELPDSASLEIQLEDGDSSKVLFSLPLKKTTQGFGAKSWLLPVDQDKTHMILGFPIFMEYDIVHQAKKTAKSNGEVRFYSRSS